MATPKAKLHQILSKIGKKCHYETCAVMAAPNGLDEVRIYDFHSQTFVCTLHLPDGGGFVRSNSFRCKKDAEQHAALLALHKLKVPYKPGSAVPATTQEKWEGLVHKVSAAFTDQMMLSYKPLAAHFRASVQRKGERFGQVPAIVLTVLDAKIMSQCRAIDALTEHNPARAAALVCRVAAACPALRLSDDGLWIGRAALFSAELVAKLLADQEEPTANSNKCCDVDEILAGGAIRQGVTKLTSADFEAVYIPACAEKEAATIRLAASPDAYHLDVIAHELGLPEAGYVFLSRQIGRTPPGTRLYWPLKQRLPAVAVPAVVAAPAPIRQEPFADYNPKDATMEALRHPDGLAVRNARASFLVGHAVDGDAVLTTVGSTWRSEGECIYNDFSLSSFQRLMLARTPWGAYKLSRQSLLVAELPAVYTSKAQWQGASPKSLLADFCRQHRLPEAKFIHAPWLEQDGSSTDGVKIKCADHVERHCAGCEVSTVGEKGSQNCSHGTGHFHCDVAVGEEGSKTHFSSDGISQSRHDAIQSAALNAVLHYDRWCDAAGALSSSYFFSKQECCRLSRRPLSFAEHDCTDTSHEPEEWNGIGVKDNTSSSSQIIAEDVVLGDCPPPGSLVDVSYTVNLVGEADKSPRENRVLEAQTKFRFKLGAGAVIGSFDACIAQARVGQTVQFLVPAEVLGVAFSACENLPCHTHGLEYTMKLLNYTEAVEPERVSHFSPSLSKQRIDYTCALINAMEAKSLVDLGCGSGSLLEALVKEPNTLEHIVGVDTSRKALVRAAKTLNATLTKPDHLGGHANTLGPTLQTIHLYEGTICDINTSGLLPSPDFATCIEVVEHMDPQALERLGESVLGHLVPRVWMVSTPNIEYNPVIRGLGWDPESNSLHKPSHQNGSLEAAGKTEELAGRPNRASNFRNRTHRFEWTRAEFRTWASRLAAQYGYQVRFGGVRGDGGDDSGPGFATQIATFAQNFAVLPNCRPYPTASAFGDHGSKKQREKDVENGDDSSDFSCGIAKLGLASEGVCRSERVQPDGTISPLKSLWSWTSNVVCKHTSII